MVHNLKSPVDALIFDMDGTLWDGVATYAQGFNDYYKFNDIKKHMSKTDLEGYMGWEEDAFLEETMSELSYKERKNAYKQIIDFQYKRITRDGGILYNGVKEGLLKLSKKYPLFIVSNCAEFTIDYFMQWAKIENLITDTIAHGVNGKPKHQNIQLLIGKHGLKNPYYIGDTDSDSQQSNLVPMSFVYVDYGFGATKKYDKKFSSFEALTNYFIND